eukprot:Skav227523  [mRNA]  locus=scaffold2269:148757:153595:- [translate_table: standard]
MQPSELQAAVVVLATALRERRQADARGIDVVLSFPVRHPLRVKLKALTIANEMLYNPRAVQEFGSVDGLRDSLEVLRQVRGSELGPAMDENVRMLATEIEVKCFHEKLPPSNGTGWTSFTKAMSSDFEKARQMAKKNLQHFSQKAEKHMEKAERVFEKGATKFMQEAENMLVGPGSSAPRDSDGSRGQKPLLTQDEEEELQWALRASLEEAQRSRRNENSASGPRERRGVAGLAISISRNGDVLWALTAMAERLAEDLCQAGERDGREGRCYFFWHRELLSVKCSRSTYTVTNRYFLPDLAD